MPSIITVLALASVLTGLSAVPAAADCSGRTTVRFGETVSSLAQRCGVNVQALRQANPGLVGANGLQRGTFVTVPRPALPTPRADRSERGVVAKPPDIERPKVGTPSIPPQRGKKRYLEERKPIGGDKRFGARDRFGPQDRFGIGNRAGAPRRFGIDNH